MGMHNATTSKAATAMTARDAYEMGRYVTRHFGSQGAADRIRAIDRATGENCVHPLWIAFFLGRDRFARMGER